MKYEIEYKNGNQEGFRIEYFENGQLKFEGEYNLNYKKNGKGKEYDDSGRLLFKGEYKEGLEWDGKKYKYNDDGQLIKEYTIISRIKYMQKFIMMMVI